MSPNRFGVAFLFVCLIACRDEDRNGAITLPSREEVATIELGCKESARVQVEKEIACGELAPEAREPYWRTYERGLLGELAPAVHAGRLTYDPGKMVECLAGRIAAPCAPSRPEVPACAEAFRGTVPAQGACMHSLECIAGHYCDVGDSFGGCRSGVCKPKAGENAACNWSPSVPCADGLICFENGPTCKPAAGEGGACSSSFECRAGLTCHAGTCRTPIALDGACIAAASPSLCEFGLFCDPSLKLCKPRLAIGLPCSLRGEDAPCAELSFCAGAEGAQAGTCQPLTNRGLGQPCEAGFNCIKGTACIHGTCRLAAPLGAPCTTDAPSGGDCLEGYCNGRAGTCVSFAAVGESCADRFCVGAARCDGTTRECVACSL